MEEKLPKIKGSYLDDEVIWVNKDGLMKRFEGFKSQYVK
ncbi:hypothetical protein A5882_002831 [Enterococcus sp. 4E1_DIV0656]|nr:hypothetical protein A5882_002831 [Enterococcus sp. 4E1_DIV0656]